MRALTPHELGFILAIGVATSAQAVQFRLPLAANTSTHFYYDHGGVKDWKCGGETYAGHRGTDFSGGPRGTAIYAGAVGTIAQTPVDGFGDGFLGSTDGGGFGNHVRVSHSGGLLTIYGHMTSGSVTTKGAGSSVSCGEQIGGVGTSGDSTGLHLHFEMRVNGVADDPYTGACSGPLSYWVSQSGATVGTTCEGAVNVSSNATVLATRTNPSIIFALPNEYGGNAPEDTEKNFYVDFRLKNVGSAVTSLDDYGAAIQDSNGTFLFRLARGSGIALQPNDETPPFNVRGYITEDRLVGSAATTFRSQVQVKVSGTWQDVTGPGTFATFTVNPRPPLQDGMLVKRPRSVVSTDATVYRYQGGKKWQGTQVALDGLYPGWTQEFYVYPSAMINVLGNPTTPSFDSTVPVILGRNLLYKLGIDVYTIEPDPTNPSPPLRSRRFQNEAAFYSYGYTNSVLITEPIPVTAAQASWIQDPSRHPLGSDIVAPFASATPTKSSSPTASRTPSNSPTATATFIPTRTPTLTPTRTNTAPAAPTQTPTSTNTSTVPPSQTPTGTPSRTGTPTTSFTPTPTLTPTPSETPSRVASVTPTYAPTRTPTLRPTNTETLTPTPADTETATPTNTQVPSVTATATASPGNTATPTETPTPSPTLTPANTPPQGVLIEVGSAFAAPGQQVRFAVTLHATEQLVGGIQNDIVFDPHASIAAKGDGTPDCAVNPGIGKEATNFTFQPPGCGPGVTCERIRAFVLSFDNVDPIPDGSVLYTCTLRLAGDAAVGSDYPLTCSGIGASDPEGNAVAAACTDGRVSAAIACNGDCNGNGQVTVDELLKGVNIALGNLAAVDCPAFDFDASGIVTVDELLKAVNKALNGCAQIQ